MREKAQMLEKADHHNPRFAWRSSIISPCRISSCRDFGEPNRLSDPTNRAPAGIPRSRRHDYIRRSKRRRANAIYTRLKGVYMYLLCFGAPTARLA